MNKLNELRVSDLKAIASEYDIEGRSKANTKAKLVNLLKREIPQSKLKRELTKYGVSANKRASPRSKSPKSPKGDNKYILQKSTRSGKKWMVSTPSGKTVHFGSAGMSDYTKHKDPERKERYIARHAGTKSGKTSSRENWTKSGLNTAGFWSRWLLWGEPTIDKSVKNIENNFGIDIVKKSRSPQTPRMVRSYSPRNGNEDIGKMRLISPLKLKYIKY